MAMMKQMEGVSQLYAHSGYMGILCIKVRNIIIPEERVDLPHPLIADMCTDTCTSRPSR